jgi:hypothetical protein
MKSYWHIPGWKDAPRGLPCIAFDKLDGQNIRCEWTKKKGWWKFGSRNVLLYQEELKPAIDIFLNKYGDAIAKVLKDEKEFRGINECIVFCEFFGENSFAGLHVEGEPKDVVLLDVSPLRKGILTPRQFLKLFGHLHIPNVVYEGNFNQVFIQDVKNGKYPVKEGVVAKGLKPTGKPPHNLWAAKVKTKEWMRLLRIKAEQFAEFKKILADNELEQDDIQDT